MPSSSFSVRQEVDDELQKYMKKMKVETRADAIELLLKTNRKK